jgi:hypothetical protein
MCIMAGRPESDTAALSIATTSEWGSNHSLEGSQNDLLEECSDNYTLASLELSKRKKPDQTLKPS